MLRFMFLAMIMACGGLQAHAWKSLNNSNFDSTVREGGCVSKTDFKRCVSSWPKYVRTDEGGAVKRYLLSRHDVTVADMEALLAELDISPKRYLAYARQQQGGSAWVKELDAFAKEMVLHGLLAEDRKTELLPPIYKTLYPVSDKLVLVRRINNAWGFIMPGDAASFRPIDFDWDNVDWFFGDLDFKPMMILFRGKSEAPGLEKYTVVDAKGEATLTIDRVVPREGRGRSFGVFDGGTLGFPVRTEEGTDISVFMSTKTLDVTRIAPPFELLRYGRVLTDNYGSNVATTSFVDAPMENVGVLSSGHGIVSGDMYLPLEYWEGKATLDHRMDGQKIIGMVPVVLTKPLVNARGWVIIYGDDNRRWYKLVAHAPEGEDFKYNIGEADELDPMDSLAYAAHFMPLADIWIGTVSDDAFADRFKDFSNPDPRDIPQPELRIVVRLFNDPANPETSGMSDWVSTGDGFHKSGVEKTYANISNLPTHPLDPQALVTKEILDIAYSQYFINMEHREDRALTPAQRRARDAQREANYQALLASAQIENADEVMQPGRSIREYSNFYTVAKTRGGKYLRAYWREYGHLPDIADSGEICRRFGQRSEECALVWPTAQTYYAEQKAQTDRDAERYAKEWLDRQYKPGWNALPKNNERRCYNNYDGTETCFYN